MSARSISILAVTTCLVAVVVAWRLAVGGAFESVDRESLASNQGESETNELVAPTADSAIPLQASEAARSAGAPSREAILSFRIEGRVASSSGDPLHMTEARVVLRDAAQNSTPLRVSLGGTFATGTLEPGEYTIEAAASDHETQRIELALAGPPRVEHVELVLPALHRLDVLVRTVRGQPLRDELMSLRAWNYSMPLYAIASREPPGETGLTLDLMDRDGVAEYSGIGHRSSRLAFGTEFVAWAHRVPPEDAIGVLRVRDLPVHVALVLESQRIATQWANPGTSEVVFALDVADLEALVPSVRMRVVAAESKTPLDGATVILETSGNPQPRDTVGLDGVFQRFGIGAGKQKLEIQCPGRVRREVEFEAGTATRVDLGDVELEKGRSVLGRLTGEVEKGEHYWLELVPALDKPREGALVDERDARTPVGSRALEVQGLTFGVDDLMAGRWFLRRAVNFSSSLGPAAMSAHGVGREIVPELSVDPSNRYDSSLPGGARASRANTDARDEELLEGLRLASMRTIEVDTTEQYTVDVEVRFVPAGILRVEVGGGIADDGSRRESGSEDSRAAPRPGRSVRLEVLDERGFSMARCEERISNRAYVALPHGSYTLLVSRDSETTRVPVQIASNLVRVTIP